MLSTALAGFLIAMAGVLGLVIGSFLNVVAYRVPAGKSLLPASRCPDCDAPIRPWQNIPVLSWLALRGRCASCNSRISARYPLVEAATGLAFAGVVWWWLDFGPKAGYFGGASTVMLLAYLALMGVTIALALIDLDTFRLPNTIVLPSVLVFAVMTGIATLLDGNQAAFIRALLGALGLVLFYGLLWFFWPGGMGFGDVKLAALLGMALGWIGWGALIVGAFAAFIFGGVFGVLLIVLRRAGRGSRIPFGPWMMLGAWFGIVAGEAISDWYVRVFFI